jgi:carboxylesterase type B
MQRRVLGPKAVLVVTLGAVLPGCGGGGGGGNLPQGCTAGPVRTAGGEVCGVRVTAAGETVDVFRGIPYGEDTGGANRWQPPVPKAAWQHTLPAVAFGDICAQETPAFPSTQPSEDCLSLNVWSPGDARPRSHLPVMVFIHGGGFETGSGSIPLYDGAYLSASQDAVVVTINYRLGALGFLAGYGGLSGNYGLLDQQLALAWVQRNIDAFGGDPTSVMLFGESAGAMSTGLHLLSIPSSTGLFSAALMESNPAGLPYKSPAEAALFGTALAKVLGCESGGLDCVRGKTAEEIVRAQDDPSVVQEGLLAGFSGFLLWAPAVDGSLVTDQPVTAATRGLPKPTILGTNRDEGILFVYPLLEALNLLPLPAAAYELLLTDFFGEENVAPILAAYPAIAGDNAPLASQLVSDYLFFCASRSIALGGGGPVYTYFFRKVSTFNLWNLFPPFIPQCDGEVCHGHELPYVFNSATDIGQMFTSDEQILSQTMADYWGAFSKPGHDPNTGGPERPIWVPFESFHYYLFLDSPIATLVDPPHHCDLWDRVGYLLIKPTALLRDERVLRQF